MRAAEQTQLASLRHPHFPLETSVGQYPPCPIRDQQVVATPHPFQLRTLNTVMTDL
jgi:hypothetical protein